MKKFTTESGIAVALDISNIDTDQIIPKQFLLAVDRKGLGKHLFHAQRYLDEKEQQLNKDFPLNQPCNQGAKFLVARENFGNGSSREHAPWALMDFGFRAIIASSFADIFSNNALGNGLLLVKLKTDEIEKIQQYLKSFPGSEMTISLENLTVEIGDLKFNFEVDEFRRHCILKGLDTIALTLEQEDQIARFERSQPNWVKL